MKKTATFSLRERAASFVPAFNGIRLLFKNEHNAWVHLFLMIAAILAGVALQVNNTEWLFLTLAITLVFLSELFNTAIERLADKVEPSWDRVIGEVKDYASAAVLIASILAVVVGAIIFIPKLTAICDL